MTKDAYYFKHDSNARNDPKIKALKQKYGVEGYGRYWIVIEILRESTNYKIEDKPYIWNSIAEEFRCPVEEAKVFIKDCIHEFNLFENGGDFFYSMSLMHRMQHLDEIRNKRIKGGKARHGIEWDD